MGREHIVPIGPFHHHHQAVAGDSGIVHQNLDFAKARQNRLHGVLDGFFAGHIQRKGRSRASRSLNLSSHFGQLAFISRSQGHRCPIRCQRQRASPSNPLRCPGHQGNPSIQSAHISS